ncbi:hypothetical protein [Halobellus rarus]|uniref:Uncharacterized protein n=1 Tax=Halobellus rarus TaxID=1126237 RepID=A0ABD6CKH6_9EURY|nr:hypothetical protein [Halobellus rarus]
MTRSAACALLVAAGALAAPVAVSGLVFPSWTFDVVGFVGFLVAVALVVAAGVVLTVVDLTSAVERALGP